MYGSGTRIYGTFAVYFTLGPMNEDDLTLHQSAMTAGGYSLDAPDFQRLMQWHGVLFQLTSAKYYLTVLMRREPVLGELEDFYEEMALLSSFVLQYSKCFTSGGQGQVTLDGKKVFAPGVDGLKSHQRILEIRNNLVAHNGNSELVLARLGVKEQEDRFVVKHFLTFALPMDELSGFEVALNRVTDYSTLAINKHLDSIGEHLGKIVLLDES